jgi:hypothetical protein
VRTGEKEVVVPVQPEDTFVSTSSRFAGGNVRLPTPLLGKFV